MPHLHQIQKIFIRYSQISKDLCSHFSLARVLHLLVPLLPRHVPIWKARVLRSELLITEHLLPLPSTEHAAGTGADASLQDGLHFLGRRPGRMAGASAALRCRIYFLGRRPGRRRSQPAPSSPRPYTEHAAGMGTDCGAASGSASPQHEERFLGQRLGRGRGESGNASPRRGLRFIG